MSEEKTIIEIIKAYLKKNRYFSSEEIIPFIESRISKSSVNLSQNGIIKILNKLVERNLIVEGSKLARDQVLSNSNRKKMYDYIIKNQVVIFNDLVKNLKIKIPVVNWHLNVLLKFDFINKTKIKNKALYYSKKTNVKNIERIYFLRKDKTKKLIEYLKINNKGVTRYQLSKELKMHSNTITTFIDKLIEFKIVYTKTIDKKTLYLLL